MTQGCSQLDVSIRWNYFLLNFSDLLFNPPLYELFPTCLHSHIYDHSVLIIPNFCPGKLLILPYLQTSLVNVFRKHFRNHLTTFNLFIFIKVNSMHTKNKFIVHNKGKSLQSRFIKNLVFHLKNPITLVKISQNNLLSLCRNIKSILF